MLRNATVVLLSNVPWDWTTDYVNQTARELSAHNQVICLHWWGAKSLREYAVTHGFGTIVRHPAPRVVVVSGVHILPFRRFRVIEALNLRINVAAVRLWVRIISYVYGLRGTVIWFFDPRLYYVARLFGADARTVYDCVDDYAGDSRLSPAERTRVRLAEYDALRFASVAAVNSRVLFEKHRKRRQDILLVPQGFRLREFARGASVRSPVTLPHPNAGYVGAVNDRLDVRLLDRLAARMPGTTFVVVGPVLDTRSGPRGARAFFRRSNVLRISAVSKANIPSLIGQFDVGIIPYRTDNPYTMNSFPMKLFEYFYMGKRVVASPIRELRRFPGLISVARTAAEWHGAIRQAMRRPVTIQEKRRMQALAMRNAWEHKINSILGHRALKSFG